MFIINRLEGSEGLITLGPDPASISSSHNPEQLAVSYEFYKLLCIYSINTEILYVNKQYAILLSLFHKNESFHLYQFSFFPFSGLNLAPVARLRTTWEKLPNKYEKLFQDLQDLFDPSRNMAKYRNVLNSQNLQPPIIPLFPVIKKDLTFLHEGKYQIGFLSSLVGAHGQ